MQLDESTNVSQNAQLLAYIRYMHADAFKEEFLFCEPLLETTKAADVLQIVNNFFAKQDFQLDEKYWKSMYRRSACNAWENLRICFFGK